MAETPLESKCVLLGDTGVGKTCITQRFVRNEFNPAQQSTSGAAFLRHTFKIGDKFVKFQLWDTAGQEKFRSLTAMYYRGASAVVIVYDVTRSSTLEDVKYWRQQLIDSGVLDAVVIVVGNKIDLPGRQVSKAEGEILAKSLGCLYGECSAKSGDGINEVFEKIAKEKLSSLNKTGTVNANQAAKKGCC
ncbi:Rab2a [Hexamita inflata]|uniref:Rab2a n=1 Tax=Hexamita inflata TaxID=28002 RepID=A0AA86PFE0_9EUKA|nr:Rab2a [Hexamita inflata]